VLTAGVLSVAGSVAGARLLTELLEWPKTACIAKFMQWQHLQNNISVPLQTHAVAKFRGNSAEAAPRGQRPTARQLAFLRSVAPRPHAGHFAVALQRAGSGIDMQTGLHSPPTLLRIVLHALLLHPPLHVWLLHVLLHHRLHEPQVLLLHAARRLPRLALGLPPCCVAAASQAAAAAGIAAAATTAASAALPAAKALPATSAARMRLGQAGRC
jgi:hypothetical protein